MAIQPTYKQVLVAESAAIVQDNYRDALVWEARRANPEFNIEVLKAASYEEAIRAAMEYSIDAYLIGAPGQSKNALEIVLGLISLMTPKERIFLVTGSHKVLEAAEKAGILNLYSSS